MTEGETGIGIMTRIVIVSQEIPIETGVDQDGVI
jgi:hypothetical protein